MDRQRIRLDDLRPLTAGSELTIVTQTQLPPDYIELEKRVDALKQVHQKMLQVTCVNMLSSAVFARADRIYLQESILHGSLRLPKQHQRG